MLIVLPIALLLVAALVIIVIDRVKPRFGTSWLIAASACILSWLIVFIMRLRLPTTLQLLSWDDSALLLIGNFSLLLDYEAWPYVLGLMTVTLAVILTDAARTRYDSSPRSWAASLVITALGLLALQAGTSLMLMVAWVIADLLELTYVLQINDNDRFNFRIIASYGVRTASILFLFLGASVGWQALPGFNLTQIPQNAGFLFLLAAVLRLGIFPLHLPFLQDPALRRGTGNIIRLVPVAAGLGLIARLPVDLLTESLARWQLLFNGLLTITALYGAVRWVSADDEIEGRPFWILTWSVMAIYAALNGAPEASLAWGTALILPGSLLFLYFPRVQRMNFLQYFGLIGLVGLPLTTAASGWAGLAANGVTIWTFLLILSHVLMVLGYLDRSLQPGGEVGSLEAWARVVFPLGLIIIIQATIALGLIGWPGSFVIGAWWMPLISTLFVAAAIILARKFGINPPYIHLPASSRLIRLFNHLIKKIQPVVKLEWLYKMAWQINHFIAGVLNGFSSLLEGSGGILWTLLLLVLIINFLSGRGPN